MRSGEDKTSLTSNKSTPGFSHLPKIDNNAAGGAPRKILLSGAGLEAKKTEPLRVSDV